MEHIGINIGLLLFQLIFVIVMAGLPIISLFDLARKK